MNYSVLVTGVLIGFSIVYYYVWGKTQYVGPLVEHQVRRFLIERDLGKCRGVVLNICQTDLLLLCLLPFDFAN